MAGANKPDSKSNTQRVSFTRRDADRIGRAVRTVESGDKKGNALTFGNRQQPSGAAGATIRVATFTGDWNYNTSKVVSFYGQTSTPNTATVDNIMFAKVPGQGTVTITCVVAKYGTSWQLVNAAHNIIGLMLQDFNLSTSELRITRSSVNFVGGTADAQVISVANCSTQVASSTSQSLFFG